MRKELEELFLLCMGNKERLKYYIDNDINLWEYVSENYPIFVQFGKNLATIRPDLKQEASNITHQDLLDLLKKKRPDLYQVIDSEGMEWFRKQEWDNLL